MKMVTNVTLTHHLVILDLRCTSSLSCQKSVKIDTNMFQLIRVQPFVVLKLLNTFFLSTDKKVYGISLVNQMPGF